MTTYKACYVDDTRSEAYRYINRLNAVGEFEVSYLVGLAAHLQTFRRRAIIGAVMS